MLAPIFQRFGPKFVFFFAKAPVIYNTKSTHKNAKSPTSGGAGYHGNHGSLGLGLLKNPGLESSWLKSPGLKSLGLNLGVENSGVEMSLNMYIVYCLTLLSGFHIYLNWKAYKDEWDLTKVVAYHQFDILNMLLLIWVHLLRPLI